MPAAATRMGYRVFAAAMLLAALAGSTGAAEVARPKVVASFSILADLARQVAGEDALVTSLVGPEADAHGYAPSPADAKRLAEAQVVIVNGLGFEGWLDRLVKASGTKAPVVVASKGVRPIAEEGAHDHGGRAHDHDHAADPHAWQNVANAKLYLANIRDGLSAADPAHAADYARNAEAALAALDVLDAEIRSGLAAIPPERRRIITTHDAFGYFAAAYGFSFLAPQGLSTESEPSPKQVAALIRQIRKERIPAVFVETISDPRLMEQVARESGARIGGRLHSDALSGPGGAASTYAGMMRANLAALTAALKP